MSTEVDYYFRRPKRKKREVVSNKHLGEDAQEYKERLKHTLTPLGIAWNTNQDQSMTVPVGLTGPDPSIPNSHGKSWAER